MSTDTPEPGSSGLDRAEKAARIRSLLETEGEAIGENTRGFNRGRYDAVAELDDYEEYKRAAREIKADAIDRLPELLDRVCEQVRRNGGTVYLADDADDATRYVREVLADVDASTVVKSKSMTSEEIEVNDAIEATGADVVETDLGEWVL
jgi:L-lactate utilization protein LutB